MKISPEKRVLSAYAINRVLERMGTWLPDQNRNLAKKIIDLYATGEDRANVAKIHENLFGHLSTSSANQALTRFINTFNKVAAETNEKAECFITQNKKGGPTNRWIWFEGMQAEFREPIIGDLNSVRSLQPQAALDISGKLATIVLFNYNNFNERDAVLDVFGYNAKEKEHEMETEEFGCYLGDFGNFRVLLAHISGQGYLKGYDSALSVFNAIRPYAILPVGIGYGAASGVEIGDVMIPGYVVDANRERVVAKGKSRSNGASEYRVSQFLKEQLFDINNRISDSYQNILRTFKFLIFFK